MPLGRNRASGGGEPSRRSSLDRLRAFRKIVLPFHILKSISPRDGSSISGKHWRPPVLNRSAAGQQTVARPAVARAGHPCCHDALLRRNSRRSGKTFSRLAHAGASPANGSFHRDDVIKILAGHRDRTGHLSQDRSPSQNVPMGSRVLGWSVTVLPRGL